MPAHDSVVFIGDVLHGRNIFFRHFFDLIAEPIRQVTGTPPRRFLPLAGDPQGPESAAFLRELGEFTQDDWGGKCFFSIPQPAREIVLAQIPARALVVSIEPVPWLTRLCRERGIDYLDVRMSPLRYGSDLYMALRSGSEEINRRLDHWAIDESRLRLEAGQLRARVKLHEEQMKLHGVLVQDLSQACVYLGQMPRDAALLADDGHYVRCEEFADAIRAAAADRNVFYKPHPYAAGFAEQEVKVLERILGRPVPLCFANAYQLLSCHPGIALIGLSSGMLQEAAYFDVSATTLFRPFCALAQQAGAQGSVNIDYQDYLAPQLWSHLLGRSVAPRRPSDSLRVPNACRENVDLWWDYGKVMTWNNAFHIDAFERSGGKVLRERIVQLEAAVKALQPQGTNADAAGAAAGVLVFLRDKLAITSMLELGPPQPGLGDVAAALGIAHAASIEGTCGIAFDLAWAAGHSEHLPPGTLAACAGKLSACRNLVCTAAPEDRKAVTELLAGLGFVYDDFLTLSVRAKSAAQGGLLAGHGLLFRRHAAPQGNVPS